MAGGDLLLAVNAHALIFDDLIDEALEYFVVTLNFQDPDNVPPLTSIESGGDIIHIDIIDNDGELTIIIMSKLDTVSCTQISLLGLLYQIQHIRRQNSITKFELSKEQAMLLNKPSALWLICS